MNYRNKMVSTISITLPEEIIEKIDKARGDINSSKYVLRLIERGGISDGYVRAKQEEKQEN